MFARQATREASCNAMPTCPKELNAPALTTGAGRVGRKLAAVFLGWLVMVLASGADLAQSSQDLLATLRGFGHGKHLFGQVATWVHNENPDPDNSQQLGPEGSGTHRDPPRLRLHHIRLGRQPLSRKVASEL